ncbi:sortase [Candidatus Peregrinibacteria bacterium]|nr:sortase [Candidatus Peregrinibacteria bacterium]
MESEPKSPKTILKNAARQLFVSIIILAAGFLVLNWSAYSQIAKSKWQKWRGIEQTTPLTGLTSPEDKPVVTENLEITAGLNRKQDKIPPLNLEITPIDNRLIIPRINQNIPIVRVSSESLLKRDWDGLEKEIQGALRDGVVHYPGTSLPGQAGNVVITGHSSYFPWDPGRFKDVFALLHDVVIGDRMIIYHNQNKYLYEVNDIQVVMPDNIQVLKQSPEDHLTLITCTPVGTNLKRLVVTAKPIAINDKIISADGQNKAILRN